MKILFKIHAQQRRQVLWQNAKQVKNRTNSQNPKNNILIPREAEYPSHRTTTELITLEKEMLISKKMVGQHLRATMKRYMNSPIEDQQRHTKELSIVLKPFLSPNCTMKVLRPSPGTTHDTRPINDDYETHNILKTPDKIIQYIPHIHTVDTESPLIWHYDENNKIKNIIITINPKL